MRFMDWEKDGGDESTVTGLYVVEIKSLFSIVLLKFDGDSREAFHSHAFNCWTWLLKGRLYETHLGCEGEDGDVQIYAPSVVPFPTKRKTFHKVSSRGVSWVLSFRGPWDDRWEEYVPATGKFRTLTHGRAEVE